MLWELFAAFAKIGLFSFGGGYAVIPLLEREIVDLHGWLSSAQTIDIIALSQMTPGPIAINLATFVGYQTAGILGAVVATLGIVAPSVLFITTSAGVNIKGIVIAVVVFFLANKNVHPVWLIVFSGLFGIIIY